jgi:hypothetical protein
MIRGCGKIIRYAVINGSLMPPKAARFEGIAMKRHADSANGSKVS